MPNHGYTPIPHNIFQEDIKVITKYREKQKLSPATIILYIANIKNMQWETSYTELAKITGWNRATLKKFLNHIGISIKTQKDINKKGKIIPIEPIKASFSECYFNAINNIEIWQKKCREDKQEDVGKTNRKKKGKSNTYDILCREDYLEDVGKIDNNNKRDNIKDNKRDNIYTTEFEKLWKLYTTTAKQYNLGECGDKKKAFLGGKRSIGYKELIKKYQEEDIYNAINNYLSKKIIQSYAFQHLSTVFNKFDLIYEELINYNPVKYLTFQNKNLIFEGILNGSGIKPVLKFRDRILNKEESKQIIERSYNDIIKVKETISRVVAYANDNNIVGNLKPLFYEFFKEG